MEEGTNRRKFFRVRLSTPICVQMTIVEVLGKEVSTGYTNVCANDLGAGGLSFLSKLVLPVSGIVRRRDVRPGVKEYGVKFTSISDEDNYLSLFNRLQVTVRKLNSSSSCNFCRKKSYPCDL